MYLPHKIKASTTRTNSVNCSFRLYLPHKIKASTTFVFASMKPSMLYLPHKIKASTTESPFKKDGKLLYLPHKIKASTTKYDTVGWHTSCTYLTKSRHPQLLMNEDEIKISCTYLTKSRHPQLLKLINKLKNKLYLPHKIKASTTLKTYLISKLVVLTSQNQGIHN